MSACALTDHGTFAGAIDFLNKCRQNKIKPILGIETYMARDHKCKNKDGQKDGRKGNRHLILLAKNLEGYKNICTISQKASLEGYYYDPRTDLELLEKYSTGVIASSACLSNPINWNLSIDRYEEAKQCAGVFKEIFKDDFYLEVMYHGIDIQAKILPDIQKIGQELDIKCYASNDSHYIKKSDAEFHEYIMCVSSGRTVKDPRRLKFPYKEFYYKSPAEMHKIFGHAPSLLKNTIEVAEKCDYSDLVFVEDGGSMRLPKFELPEGFTDPYVYLVKLAWDGLKRLKLDQSQEHVDRLKLELSDIKLVWDTKRYDFSTYFLIVQDVMNFAKRNKIGAGVRGSGYGSLLLKCIGVVDSAIDPVKMGLLWTRFLGFDAQYFISEQDFGNFIKR